MRNLGRAVMVAGACLAAAGCVSNAQSTANPTANPSAAACASEGNGDALIASGFKMVPANTPERQAALRQLPAQQFVRRLRGDKVVFLYADPANCNCLYAGNVTAYAAFTARTRQEQRLADEQAMDNWDFTPWAFGFPSNWPDD